MSDSYELPNELSETEYVLNDIGVYSTHKHAIFGGCDRNLLTSIIYNLEGLFYKYGIKQVAIPFSGGYDSTLTLAILHELCKKYTRQLDVNLLYVNAKFSPTKRFREQEAIENIINTMKGMPGGFLRMKLHTVDFSFGDNNPPAMRLVQTGLWTSLMSFYVGDVSAISDSAVLFSYIKGDDSLLYTNEIKESLHSLTKITKVGKSNDDECQVFFPLMDFRKEDVLMSFYNINPKLITLATTCENPDTPGFFTHPGEEKIDEKEKMKHKEYHSRFNCGHCLPCKHLEDALLLIITSLQKECEEERERNEKISRFQDIRNIREIMEMKETIACRKFFEEMLYEKFGLRVMSSYRKEK